MIFDQKQVNIILASLLVEYELMWVEASITQVSLDLLTEMLLDCGAIQLNFLPVVPMQANLVSQQKGNGESQSKQSTSSGYNRNYSQLYKQHFRGGIHNVEVLIVVGDMEVDFSQLASMSTV